LPYLPPQVDLSPSDSDYPRHTGSHRAGDSSLLFSSLGRAIAGSLVAVAVIIGGIAAINAFQKDDGSAPIVTRPKSAKPRASVAASSASTSGTSATASAEVPDTTATEPAPAAEPESSAPAAAPGAAASDSAAAAAVRLPLLVLNSSRITGLAASAKKDFEKARWTVRAVGNTSYRASITTVYYMAGQEAAARQLMRDVPAVRRMELRPRALPGEGLTVVVTREYAG
jgi:hypothetical protein